MTVFDDLHVRALHVQAKGGPLYVTEAEQAEVDEAGGYPPAVAASGYTIEVDDTKAAAQAKAAAKSVVLPAEPDLPGVSV